MSVRPAKWLSRNLGGRSPPYAKPACSSIPASERRVCESLSRELSYTWCTCSRYQRKTPNGGRFAYIGEKGGEAEPRIAKGHRRRHANVGGGDDDDDAGSTLIFHRVLCAWRCRRIKGRASIMVRSR
ncbi:unnamed protein product [Phyllotreta striolata]|uniref:Uncharacterized protein n=1 Tax=Phyllotreta striolata TaxID=444603 RepID=A0A9N9TJ91_PHYSR|nr:unnamed protein product [Phyllotreta striolata]